MGSFPASHGADYLRLFEDSIPHQHPIVFDIFCTGRVGSAQVQKGLDDYLATKFQTQRQIFWRFSEVDLIQWRLIFSKGIMTPKGPSC